MGARRDAGGAPGRARVTDREEIADLIHAYCLHFDQNEPEAVAALFTEDATIDYGPEAARIEGREAIAPTIAVGLETIFAATSHHVSNIRIELDGADRATPCRPPGPGPPAPPARPPSRTSTRGTATATGRPTASCGAATTTASSGRPRAGGSRSSSCARPAAATSTARRCTRSTAAVSS